MTGASTITTNADATISAGIAAGGLFKNGTGVLTLSGVNTIAGMVIADGTIQLGSATAFTSGSTLTLGLPDANTVTLDLNTFDATVGAISSNNAGGTKTITNTGATLSTFTINNAAATNLGGLFTGTNLKLSQTGAALLTLTAANSYGGGTSITGTGGVLITDLGALGGGAAAIGAGSQLDINTAGGTLANALTLNGGTLRQSAANQVTATGLITVNSASTINVAVANPGKLFISGGFSGVGDLVRSGNGILQITVASPTYSGNWTINGGQTEAQIAGALGTGGVTVNTGGELVASNALIGNNVTIGSAGALLSFDNGGAGDFRGTLNAAQNFTVILKDFYQNVARNGTISGVISGAGNMSVTAPAPTTTTVSSLLLTGNNAAYTGTITVGTNAQVRDRKSVV